MKLLINNQPVTFPSSLSEFTLGQRIDFYTEHGRELEEMAKSILDMEEGFEKDLEISQFQFEQMFRTFAFFTGCTVEAAKDSQFVDDIARIYYSNLSVLFEDEQAIDLKQEFTWNHETWVLYPPELKHGDKITFGELVDSKQMVKDMIEVGRGKWEYMLPLCAIYLRRKDEAYQESWLYEGSERLQLMRSLPMDIALQVGFFLSSSMNIYMNIFRSSGQAKSKDPVDIVNNILTAGDGPTSSSQ